MTFLPDCMNTTEKSEAGVTFPVLRLDTGQPLMNGATPVTITVKGPDSVQYRTASRDVLTRRTKTLAAGGEFDDDRAEVELLAAVTIAWTGMHDGKNEAPCTFENAVKLYTEFPVVKDQINGRVNSRRYFTKGSPQS